MWIPWRPEKSGASSARFLSQEIALRISTLLLWLAHGKARVAVRLNERLFIDGRI
jgi:hypothetical protein